MSDSGPPAFSATGSWVLPAPAQLLATLQHASGEVPCDVRAVRRLGLAVVVDAACEIRAGEGANPPWTPIKPPARFGLLPCTTPREGRRASRIGLTGSPLETS